MPKYQKFIDIASLTTFAVFEKLEKFAQLETIWEMEAE